VADEVVLSWPAAATNYALETTGALASGATWTPLTNGIATAGDTCLFTNRASGHAAFYRLHRQVKGA